MKLFGYRVLENDEDGDPMNHGLVIAEDQAAAEKIVGEVLFESLESGSWETRFYDHGDVDGLKPGHVESNGYVDVVISLKEESDGTDASTS